MDWDSQHMSMLSEIQLIGLYHNITFVDMDGQETQKKEVPFKAQKRINKE